MKRCPHLHKNSFNALAGSFKNEHPLSAVMHILAQIGYVLSDILEVLEEKEEGDV